MFWSNEWHTCCLREIAAIMNADNDAKADNDRSDNTRSSSSVIPLFAKLPDCHVFL
jgi:hypothetical protein